VKVGKWKLPAPIVAADRSGKPGGNGYTENNQLSDFDVSGSGLVKIVILSRSE